MHWTEKDGNFSCPLSGATAEPHPDCFTAFKREHMRPFLKAVKKSGWGSAMAPLKGQENLPSSKVQRTMCNNFCLEEEGPTEAAAERVLVWTHLHHTGMPKQACPA